MRDSRFAQACGPQGWTCVMAMRGQGRDVREDVLPSASRALGAWLLGSQVRQPIAAAGYRVWEGARWLF